MNKILIAGGTGFVGKHLIKHLVNCGYAVNVLTRRDDILDAENIQYFQWNIEKEFIDKKAFENVIKIINLTGVNIGERRWTRKRKVEIIESRIKAIDLLYSYVKTLNVNITTFISSSAVGYYGAITSDEIFTEMSGNGNDFLASVCKKWENAALQFEKMGVATIILRKGIVLGKEGGIYKKLAPLARLGINVSLGNGKQYLPWVDIRDLVRLYEFILQRDEMQGIFNVVSSEYITMNDFSKALLQSFGKRSILPNAPAFFIKLWFREMSVMLLEGSKVCNEKLTGTSFQFDYDSIKKALGNK